MHVSVKLLKLLLLLSVFLFPACLGKRTLSMKQKADELSINKEYEQAIQAYQDHIKQRASIPNKPDWENPYIYLLDIGDIYLEMGMVEKALESYERAAQHDVKQGYVNDRLRYIATWYEEQGEIESAIEHLQKYREKDELLFDLMLNRLARKLVALEEAAEDSESPENPSPEVTTVPE